MSPKRLTIEISDELHRLVKQRVAARGISIRKWLLAAIVQQLKKEEQTK